MSHCDTPTAANALMDLVIERLIAGDSDAMVVRRLTSFEGLAALGHIATVPDLVAVTREVLPFLADAFRCDGTAAVLMDICARYVSDEEAAFALRFTAHPLTAIDLVGVIRLAAA